jgi:hypothetical protein
MRKLGLSVVALGLLGVANAKADVTFTVNPADPYVGYMNVSEIPQNGGAYIFGSSWGTSDLRATFSGNVLSLGANTVGDPNPFWYSPSGGPGAIGNKTMDANMYVEQTGALDGEKVTFTGNVLSNTLVGSVNQLGNGWTSVAFIKDFSSDYSSSVSVTAPLVNGVFSISLNTINDPTRHVQYGFETIGPDVWAGDPLTFDSIQITGVPEPTSAALLGLGAMSLIARRRRIWPKA